MIAVIVITLLSIAVAGLSFACFRLSKKLLQFDELFEMLVDEIDINTRYFEKLLQMPLFLNSPEIEEANKNMRIMQVRLEEFTNRMAETRGQELLESPEEEEERVRKLPRPVVK